MTHETLPLGAAPRCGIAVAKTPGANSDEAVNAMGRMALDACLAVLRGEKTTHVVNPDVYTRMDNV